MSFISGLTHIVAQPIGWCAEALGGAQDLLPGKGTSQLTNFGHNITSPNVLLSNHSGLISGNNPAFTGAGAYNPAYVATTPQVPMGVQQQVLPQALGQARSGGIYDPSNPHGLSSAQQQANAQAAAVANAALGRLPGQLQTVQNQVRNTYNQNLNELESGRNLAQQNYNQYTAQNQQQFVTNKNQINDQASGGLRSLLSILGQHGAGGSAAAMYAVPNAVGQQDYGVRKANEEVFFTLKCHKELAEIPKATHLFEEPGTIERVAELASTWFKEHLRA